MVIWESASARTTFSVVLTVNTTTIKLLGLTEGVGWIEGVADGVLPEVALLVAEGEDEVEVERVPDEEGSAVGVRPIETVTVGVVDRLRDVDLDGSALGELEDDRDTLPVVEGASEFNGDGEAVEVKERLRDRDTLGEGGGTTELD